MEKVMSYLSTFDWYSVGIHTGEFLIQFLFFLFTIQITTIVFSKIVFTTAKVSEVTQDFYSNVTVMSFMWALGIVTYIN